MHGMCLLAVCRRRRHRRCLVCCVYTLHIVVYMPRTAFKIGIFSVKLCEQFTTHSALYIPVSQLSHIAATQPLCTLCGGVTTEPKQHIVNSERT